jgi:pantetheine-phosphate adenylyltransferase
MSIKKIEKVAVGGTFDTLHKGHKKLLLEAFRHGAHVLIGLTTDSYIKKRNKKHEVNPYEKRKSALENFLRKEGLLKRAEIIPINDMYGVTLQIPSLDAIVVSEETYQVAKEINQLRKKRNYKELKIFTIKMVLAENGKPISNSRIRRGEINAEGRTLTSL